MEKIYCVKDSNGRFEGKIKICSMEEKSDWKWTYISDEFAISGNLVKENAELKVMKLRELNAISKYDNLDWEVVELSEKEHLDNLAKLQKRNLDLGRDILSLYLYNYSVEWKDVKKGCIGLHRKMVKDIYKKYDGLMKKMI